MQVNMAIKQPIKFATLPTVVLSVNTFKNALKPAKAFKINTTQAIIIILLHHPYY